MPSVVSPAKIERIAPERIERELVPRLELPSRAVPTAPAAPLERVAPPQIERDVAPPVQLPTRAGDGAGGALEPSLHQDRARCGSVGRAPARACRPRPRRRSNASLTAGSACCYAVELPRARCRWAGGDARARPPPQIELEALRRASCAARVKLAPAARRRVRTPDQRERVPAVEFRPARATQAARNRAPAPAQRSAARLPPRRSRHGRAGPRRCCTRAPTSGARSPYPVRSASDPKRKSQPRRDFATHTFRAPLSPPRGRKKEVAKS